jgi:hypothetical protein
MLSSEAVVRRTGLDEVALKPRSVDLASLHELPAERITIDYEGAAAVPSPTTLRRLADRAALRVTVPVRADGFDPLGDDRRWAELPDAAGVALVAGDPAYLTATERGRRIAPRLAAGLERSPDAWIGTEGIEQLALATGATQFELLGPDTERRVRELRDAGFDGRIAVYAPTVLASAEDDRLDALGGYVARRQPVAEALPSGSAADSTATGRARELLLAACEDYAIVGGIQPVRERVEALRAAGVDDVVGYPARGLDEFRRAE